MKIPEVTIMYQHGGGHTCLKAEADWIKSCTVTNAIKSDTVPHGATLIMLK